MLIAYFREKTMIHYAIFTAAALASSTAMSGSAEAVPTPNTPANNPYALSDHSSILLSGVVERVTDTGEDFILNYGNGVINVETADELDALYRGPTAMLTPGQRVTVSGHIDDDLFEGREIKAHAVNFPETGEFYSNYAQPQEYYYMTYFVPQEQQAMVTGTVKQVMPEKDMFTVDYGQGELVVNAGDLSYNPLKDNARNPLEPGDRVILSGQLTDQMFSQRTLSADSVTQLDSTTLKRENTNEGQRRFETPS
jgi:uncharacterized protein YdeI (BOF family)